jgi:hypothetical protein
MGILEPRETEDEIINKEFKCFRQHRIDQLINSRAQPMVSNGTSYDQPNNISLDVDPVGPVTYHARLPGIHRSTRLRG